MYRITQGNPFFNNQFLKSLYEEGLITFNRDAGSWQCDLAQVNALALTDDVVEFLAIRLQKLPARHPRGHETGRLHRQFVRSGDALHRLSAYPRRVSADLWPVLQAGLIIPQNAVFKIYPRRWTGHLDLPSMPMSKFRSIDFCMTACSRRPTR